MKNLEGDLYVSARFISGAMEVRYHTIVDGRIKVYEDGWVDDLTTSIDSLECIGELSQDGNYSKKIYSNALEVVINANLY